MVILPGITVGHRVPGALAFWLTVHDSSGVVAICCLFMEVLWHCWISNPKAQCFGVQWFCEFHNCRNNTQDHL